MDYFELKYLIFVSGTLVFSFLINRIFLKFVKTLGIRNTSETIIRWSATSKPSIGGLTFYIAFLLSLSVYAIAFSTGQDFLTLRDSGVLLACTVGFLMGLADDAYNTKPILKSLTQLGCGAILILTGTSIQLFEQDPLNWILTLIWVMGIMNSINMLDNMDGITASVSLIISLTLLFCIWNAGGVRNLYFILVSGLICSLFAFLYFNWHPSKMFMGDSGSQFLGIILAALGIMYFWNHEPLEPDNVSLTKRIIMPLLAFIVPIADTTTVVINRLAKGTSPFVGGKDHTTHNLARLGLSDRMVAFTIVIICIVSSTLILQFYSGPDGMGPATITALSLFVLGVFFSLFSVTQVRRK